MSVQVRPARSDDLPALEQFEITIAQESFGDEAITDPAVHRSRLEKALERDPEGCLVGVDDEGRVVGWLWLSINSNFLTRETYASFRSLAVTESPDQGEVARALVKRALAHARAGGAREVIGKVSADNLMMRVLYRELGFEPRHLTMRLTWDEE